MLDLENQEALALPPTLNPVPLPTPLWSEARTILLISRWEAGCSAGEISKELGITRNSVIGKADRMKLVRKIDNVFWSDEDTETLREMWARGYPAKDIAKRIHRRGERGPYLTRGSVLSRANCIGLKPRTPQQRARSPSAGRKPGINPALLEGPIPKGFLSVSFENLADDQCRFPRGGDKAPIVFCGKPRTMDSSYCAACHARCYSRCR